MRTGGLAAAMVLAAGFSQSAAAATYTIFTDRTAFLAASGATAVETFNNQPETEFRNGSRDAGAFALVDFHNRNTAGSTRISQRSNVGGRLIDGTTQVEILAYEFSSFLEGNVALRYDAPVRAFGADFIAANTTSRVNLKIDGQSFVREAGQNGFFGVVADADFSDITVTLRLGQNDFVAFDNVTYASSVSAVPEPATWAMMVGGFGLAGAAARRTRKEVRYA